ncbi:hypothetical protein F5888DRAFT_1720043 [Russula emetica]|nr:hypothetical protein F5888DRAFT_1720043 [Russula emetica]
MAHWLSLRAPFLNRLFSCNCTVTVLLLYRNDSSVRAEPLNNDPHTLNPEYIVSTDSLYPEVARFMLPIELGHSDASILFSHRLSMAYDSSKARLCSPDNPSSFDTTTLSDSSHLVLL